MNTFYQYSYRINALFFLTGLLLLALLGQPRLAALQETLKRLAAVTTSAPTLVVSTEPPAALLLQADALVLPKDNGTAQVTARVRDAQGNPVAGATVQFASTLGTLLPEGTLTDATGVAHSTFQAMGLAGRVVITARVNDLSRETAIQLVNPATSATTNVLNLDFSASQLDPGQSATIQAVLRDSAGQPVAGELVTLFGSLGEVTPASAMSDANGRVTATYRAGPNGGTGMITALAGVAAKSVTFQVSGSGAPGQLTGRAFLPLVSR
ncbi:MAG: hypothetical protein DYG89_54370 [Caldilinea sp. CFX5]|nr:hypothetical protein [Caldilinea sp. CFX5]